MACTAKSSTMIPVVRAISDDPPSAMAPHDSNNSANATPVTRCPKPRSADTPAFLAASAPAMPARPNIPICAVVRLKGAVLSGKTTDVHRTLKFMKISSASTPRERSSGISRHSDQTEPINCRYAPGFCA
ncbi:hypothetical protein D3C76_994580 [compost metagenome]